MALASGTPKGLLTGCLPPVPSKTKHQDVWASSPSKGPGISPRIAGGKGRASAHSGTCELLLVLFENKTMLIPFKAVTSVFILNVALLS